MADWLIERGIGEDRALLIEHGQVMAAKLRWPGELRTGDVVSAKLVSRRADSPRGVARTAGGTEILLDRLPKDASGGGVVSVAVARAAIAERGRMKRATGRVLDPSQAARARQPDVFDEGIPVRRFAPGLWEEVWDSAWDASLPFERGSLLFSITPAMTVIDVDGEGAPLELCLAAVPPLARGLRWFDIGGSIGVDFPTVPDKQGRARVDRALAAALADWPHERTAMNGFGFVQIVARLEGPSLLHRMAVSRAGAAARLLLRRAEALEGAGALLLVAQPAVVAALQPAWLEDLARRTGREVRTAADPALALDGGHAQLVAR